jgi:hypothetical protein
VRFFSPGPPCARPHPAQKYVSTVAVKFARWASLESAGTYMCQDWKKRTAASSPPQADDIARSESQQSWFQVGMPEGPAGSPAFKLVWHSCSVFRTVPHAMGSKSTACTTGNTKTTRATGNVSAVFSSNCPSRKNRGAQPRLNISGPGSGGPRLESPGICVCSNVVCHTGAQRRSDLECAAICQRRWSSSASITTCRRTQYQGAAALWENFFTVTINWRAPRWARGRAHASKRKRPCVHRMQGMLRGNAWKRQDAGKADAGRCKQRAGNITRRRRNRHTL